MILDVHVALQRGHRRAIAPNQPKNALQGSAGSRTRSGQVCNHVWSHAKTPEDQHPRRSRRGPKADPRTGQRTRRPSGHALIWGGRILGWSLRRIAAALEASRVAPPGKRAGYTAGTGQRTRRKWTAAAVQRICRRHGIATARPAEPPRWFLSYARRYPDSNH